MNISRIALKLHSVQNLSLTQQLGKRGRFAKVSTYVAVWEVIDKEIRLVEVSYVGTHEKAPC